MKNIYKLFILILSVSTVGCTDLDEELYGRLSPDNYYQTEAEALSSVVGVYQKLASITNNGSAWRVSVMGADEFLVPARTNGGWYDGGIWVEYAEHNVTPNNIFNVRAWTELFGTIGAANAVIESLEASPNAENLTAMIAETKALRAYAYFYAMDFWGNVPLLTEARVDAQNLPTNTPRAEVYDFVVTELEAALAELPSINDVDRMSYYPRWSKETVNTALATIYLNAEVYTGTAALDKVLEHTNAVITSSAYSLEAQVVDCFLATNEENSTEIIASFSCDPNQNAGNNQFILYVNHALDKDKYDLPFTPAGGYSVFQEALDRYADGDERKDLIEYGPQTHLNGDPLLKEDGSQLVLTEIQDILAAENDEGYHLLKYAPQGVNWAGFNADNDFILFRYSDILLMKAEALFRQDAASTEALALVNEVRDRSSADPLLSLTLNDIEEERAREFIWEGHRRRDMIRFGSWFDGTWKFKTSTSPDWRGIYPIPGDQINANPNLKQNPNY
ncbi:RagB/SusD family nutrient uptake outer membrane protein [Marinoscillum sp. MHG1-6]|uniref:RagB/SusD family nutrient uptake outer membrane protein n=1 Tax=Marinoscillum sp. MHG1-6 TaxID=2959627 RepID=UPI002157965C|nr:RagB/SusD family nutrient uptake outer membrane protein [Marinoscillum sp. MHG1-6]